MNLWSCTLRELRRHPGRTLLTLLGVALGVATVTATATSGAAVRQAYRDLFAGLTGPAALEVTAAGGAGFDATIADELGNVPGVRAVEPRIRSTAALLGGGGAGPVVVLGSDRAAEEFGVASGRPPRDTDDVLLPSDFAAARGLTVGAAVPLWTPTGRAVLRLCGCPEPKRTAAVNGGAVAVVSLATARRLFALPGQVNGVRLLLAEDADARRVADAVSARLPPGLSLDADTQGDLARSTLRSAELGLSGLGVTAVVAAAFVLLNTFLLSLDERRRQLAALRALGATRRQVRGLLLREAALLGGAGSLLGVAAGLALAFLLARVLGGFLDVAVPPPRPHPGTVLPAALLGPLLALAVGWLPARRAANRPPLNELLDRGDRRERGVPAWTVWLGVLLLTAAGVVAAAVLRGRVPPAAGLALLAPVVGLLAVGGVLVLPPVAGLLLAGAGRLPRRWLGVAGVLALGQLTRRPVRTGLTCGVLFVAVVMAIGFGQLLLDTLDDLGRWYRRAIPADFLIRGAMPDTALVLAPALPEALADELAAVDGVERVDRIAFVPARVSGRSVLLLARTLAADRPPPLDLRDGDPDSVLRGVLAGGAVPDPGLAHSLGLRVGDTLSLETAAGPRPLRIAGTAAEYAAGGSAVYLEWETARRLLPPPGVHVFLVTARPGETERAGAALRTWCARRGLMLQANDDLRRLIDRSLARVTAALWALMALAFVVAALGVANTLTMNVRQQRRTFAVLRAVGLTRGGLRRLVLAQALLIGLAGVVPGAAGGVGLAWLLERLTDALLGRRLTFHANGALAAGACALALLAGLLAALPAARRVGAAGVDPP